MQTGPGVIDSGVGFGFAVALKKWFKNIYKCDFFFFSLGLVRFSSVQLHYVQFS